VKTYWQRINSIVGPAYKEEFDKVGQKKTRDAIEKFILSVSDNNTLLLDAGCNTGVEAYRLMTSKYKGKYLGVDSNFKAISLARKNLKGYPRVKFIVQDISKLNFKDKNFDIVLLKDVIEHYRDYRSILKELTRVTKKWFILSMFIKPSRFLKTKIRLHPDEYYLNRYNRKNLFKFFAQRNFNESQTIYSNFRDEVFVFKKLN